MKSNYIANSIGQLIFKDINLMYLPVRAFSWAGKLNFAISVSVLHCSFSLVQLIIACAKDVCLDFIVTISKNLRVLANNFEDRYFQG